MFDFLEQYTRRMKNVGAHAFIHKNSLQKTTWKNYGFEQWYEQINMIFLVLLYIMEQSLKEEPCTIDDLGGFIDDLNRRYFKKEISYEGSKALADFIVNTILCDEGRAMYFNGYDFEKEAYVPIHISYVGNKVIFLEGEVRRTSYFLTTEGYNFVLSTLEIENNLKLTVQEMIFKLHLEKANYSQAVDDVKGIFNHLRIKLQEIQEAMSCIRQNALSYSVEDYKCLQEETLGALADTKKKYEGYKQVVKENIQQLEAEHINVKKLDEKQQQNLTHLQIIEGYLSRAIEEQQRILGMHFDLKSLYEKELEGISAMTLIKRFSLASDLYEPLLKDASMLLRIENFLRPLFNQEVEKTYNLNLAFLEQKPIRKKKVEEEETLISFEADLYEAEKIRQKRERLKKYKSCLGTLLRLVSEQGKITLGELEIALREREDDLKLLIPTVEIFREVMIELIKNRKLVIADLVAEKEMTIEDESLEFHLTTMLLQIIEEESFLRDIKTIKVYKVTDGKMISFKGLPSEKGTVNIVKCTDVMMEIER
ncbi:hypothetical protein [Cellulosilyticum ruminicola]|uniref:hypothetical protein n=1 Tax=Cellulosilyticum ruminicola TaxID=425254 RepID=UPI0006D03C23|nr:hypothetical protein [Cellulosilyticum ruminicola]